MKLVVAAVTARRQGLRSGPARDLFQMYLDRTAPYGPVETIFADSEVALLERLRREAGRVPPLLVLLDSRGKQMTSEGLADRIESTRDAGAQQMVFAIGPANGWSATAKAEGQWLLSLGPLTLPHELALVVLAEQLYRAQTILAGHPYHSGH